MCRHKHTTVVNTLTDLGLVLIHQCDMCGVYVPSKRVSLQELVGDVDGETVIVADERAAVSGYERLIRKVVSDG